MFTILLSTLGLLYILKYSAIFDGIRTKLSNMHSDVEELFGCSLCLGFWTGVIHMPLVWHEYGIAAALAFPCASAAWCWTVDEMHDALVAWRATLK